MSNSIRPLEGRVAVVTGGGSGMGAASVRSFAAAGAHVFAVDRNGSEEKVAAEIGDRVTPFRADVSVVADLEALMDAVAQAYGRLDVLFNNAGTAGPSDQRHVELEHLSLEQMELMWSVNLRAVVVASSSRFHS